MFSSAFEVVEFHYRDDGDGFFACAPFWGVVVTFSPGDSRVLFESERRGLVVEKCHDLVKLVCDPLSEWRWSLPKGRDFEFGLWGYADRPSRDQVIEERAARRCKQRSALTGALSAVGGAEGSATPEDARRTSSASRALHALRVDIDEVLQLADVLDVIPWADRRL